MTGPKKYLGQHFLTAPATAKRIAAAVPANGADARVPPVGATAPGRLPFHTAPDGLPSHTDGGRQTDARVLEIGPGRGALSVHLLERFPRMHMVEIDRDAAAALTDKLGAGSYTVHNEDVATFDFSKAGFPLHVVGNLPYNIGAVIIKKTLLYAPDVLSCTFMVQREVARRAVSGPHSRENGWLSVFCQFFGAARLLFNVPPGSFFPRPNVDSSVFQIIVDGGVEKKLERGAWDDFFSFVDAGFSMRRKQLAKALSLRYGRDKDFYGGALSDIGAGAAARAEDLDAGAWLALYKRAR